MSLFGQTKRHIPPGPRRSPLPIFTGDNEKFGLSSPTTPTFGGGSRWYTIVVVPIPHLPFLSSDKPGSSNGLGPRSYYQPRHSRYVRIPVPIPPKIVARISRFHPIIKLALLVAGLISLAFFLVGFRSQPSGRSGWSPPFTDPSTLVITPEEAAKIWEWEVLSGHHPSVADAPASVPIEAGLINPVVPASLLSGRQPADKPAALQQARLQQAAPSNHKLVGKGPERTYLSPWDTVLENPGFPPRPLPGSTVDLDIILQKCDFGTNKYVRDCLELLRIGGNLDNGKRVRSAEHLASFKQSFMEKPFTVPDLTDEWTPVPPATTPREPNLSRTALSLGPPLPVTEPFLERDDPCDPDHPRLFHMFWAGPFSDKPYMAIMSFLFTQNLGLHRPATDSSDVVQSTCRSQFWVWINPGPAAAVPNPTAKRDMFEQLATNPWSAPFLHERFRDVVKFKMWNTTEQLDGVAELQPYWRKLSIFNSGGNVYKESKSKKSTATKETSKVDGDDAEDTDTEVEAKTKKDGLFEKVGSTSESDYDRLSVILSDLARFVVTHRFGGIYLDADTLFLRDWEELWNYRGQFAYRWSWHAKYNTAVLKLHKHSALSSFLFKTALENGLDFHPMTVTRYLQDAGLDKLLFRIPDALFDPAWINMERYQRDRPPFPYFPEFSYFFSNDKFETAGPEQLGFDGFFRGAFSYHFHNFWWLPFDPSRNWPDLGPRFSKGDAILREAARQAALSSLEAEKSQRSLRSSRGEEVGEGDDEPADLLADQADLSWSTVLKRTFEAYLRGERPNMYGEWIKW
ncbi:hypothetical protein Q8F55_004032 [Vanrija albida]|uniref:WD repeat and SOF domain-containing protein 1 n=1 Tax=Vanrija albida TaxID=181172 RepID=A0ABR3Q5V6_9TREE